MTTGRWRLYSTPATPRLSVAETLVERCWLEDWDEWLREGLLPGTPFLISPGFEYDVGVNGFFADVPMATSSQRTLEGYARDLTAFFNFLWLARDGRPWRDATAADHLAYLQWRRRALGGCSST